MINSTPNTFIKNCVCIPLNHHAANRSVQQRWISYKVYIHLFLLVLHTWFHFLKNLQNMGEGSPDNQLEDYYDAPLFWEHIFYCVVNVPSVTIHDPWHVSFRVYCHAHILSKHLLNLNSNTEKLHDTLVFLLVLVSSSELNSVLNSL